MTGFLTDRFKGLSRRARVLLLFAVLVPLYLLYTSGITTNPPAFYLDEAAVSYNAYTIAHSGQGEFGQKMPLYFPVFPLGPPFFYLGYVEPTQIYALALIDLFVTPSVAISRGLSATAMFFTAFLLGLLAFKISGRRSIGFILGFTALLTPWLFEMGRLAFGASLYPFTIAVLLIAIYNAIRKEKWTILDCIWIALALALTTYTYAIGRMLGPLLAFGLILFANNRERIVKVLATWAAYALSLIPMLIFHLNNPDALTGRFTFSVGYMSAAKGYRQIFTEFLGHYLANISPDRLLFIGDMNLRHHITATAPVFWVTVFMAIAGIVFVILYHRRETWWRYVFFGLIVSVVPASLTKDDFHMLRLSAFPVFLLVMSIPTLIWLAKSVEPKETSKIARWSPIMRIAILALLLISTFGQFVSFYAKFSEIGPTRGGYFDFNFPTVFGAAMERPERPIYLVDQFAYHAMWQAISQGIDLSNFERLAPKERPPANSLVLSGEETCKDCEMLVKDIPFVLYKTLSGPPPPTPTPSPVNIPNPVDVAPFAAPRGINVDAKGNYFVADTGNALVQKFDADGKYLSAIGARGEGVGEFREPQGVAIDKAGNIYVTDALNHKLVKFKADGSFVKEWPGPDSGFYGPRDISFGPNGLLYIVDQGRTRVARFDPANDSFIVWGTAGSAEGQFSDPSGIAVGGGYVFVTDTGNGRIQVFDLDGTFVRQWPVPQWENDVHFITDAAFDEATGTLYVSSGKTNEMLAFDKDGNRIEGPKPADEAGFGTPSSLAIQSAGKKRTLLILDSSDSKLSKIELWAINPPSK